MSLFSTQPFLGFRLAAISTDTFLQMLLQVMRERSAPFVVSYLNAATVNLAFASPVQARRLAQVNCLYADGQAVVWASRWLGRPIVERINAGDFTPAVIQAMARDGLKLALIGGRPAAAGQPGEAERAAQRFQSWAPGLSICLIHHGFFAPEEAPAVSQAIERADPDLVLLGMGSPRQEACALEWSRAGAARAWWCVGALFEYYAGTRARAPQWMRRAGLEWLFRLSLEPKRLWRRYLIGNPLFLWRIWRGWPPEGIATRK